MKCVTQIEVNCISPIRRYDSTLNKSYLLHGMIKGVCISAIFCVWFFELLSLFLLFLVVTHRFHRRILRSSSYALCLSEQMIQPRKSFLKFDCYQTRCSRNMKYSNNIVIVFHAYQPKKYHKKFYEKHQKMNSKRKILWHQLFLIFSK